MTISEAWPIFAALIGLLGAVGATYLRDRNNPMAQTVLAANATTSQMQAFIEPLRQRLDELESKVEHLEAYVATLQGQVRELGGEPLPFRPPKGQPS